MPPGTGTAPRQPRRQRSYVLGFERAHPNIQAFLLRACDASTPLLLATILAFAGVMKRPPWERTFLWYAALSGFLSRWIAVTCAVTWMLNGWGSERPRGEQGPGRDHGDAGNAGGELAQQPHLPDYPGEG